MTENTLFDKKSLKTVVGKNAKFSELAKDCVAFANAKGGHLHIGIEDEADLPPKEQKIDDSLLVTIDNRIKGSTQNVFVRSEKVIASNGAEYIDMTIFPAQSSIASTSDGKYYLRVGDTSSPLMPDDLMRLLNDKPSFIWETKITRVHLEQADGEKKFKFINDIKNSTRVSDFVKQKTDNEIYETYQMCDENGFLTNLGVLWLGSSMQRARISYTPVVQVIKYDVDGKKINKFLYDDYSLNPKEMLEKILDDVPDWKESYEVSDGLFRKTIPAYDPVVVRELIVNALVHRPYTTRGDIFINLYPNEMLIRNPGILPLGVTPENILSKSVQRNEHLSKVFYDLSLMEKEGSGYDIIFEKMLCAAKPVPEVIEDDDSVCVKVQRKFINEDLVQFMDKVASFYNLTQREKICVGIVAQNGSISTLDLAKKLAIKREDDLRSWTNGLIRNKLVQITGKTKGSIYSVTKETFKNVKYQTKTTLMPIEKYRIKELILQDLITYKTATFSEIRKRIGEEIPEKKVREQLQVLIEENKIEKVGDKKWAKYHLL